MVKKSLLIVFACSLALSTGCAGDKPDTRDTASPFGVLDFLAWNHDWNKNHYSDAQVEQAAKMMKDAGVAIVRLDFLWADVEPEQGKFDFSRTDRIVDVLTKNDIKILGLLNYNAGWAAKEWNRAPDPELFTNYATRVVKRYKGKVKYWEVWNEPDDKLYWQPQDYMKSYTALLKKVTPAIKKEDPSAVIVLGGIAKFIPQSLKHVYENGGKDYFDVVNAHPFQDPMLPAAMNQLKGAHKGLRKVMRQFGDEDKPIWFTELGAPGVKPGTKKYKGWWLGPNPTEEVQARWLTKIYKNTMKMEGVEKVFWAFFRDLNDFFDSGVNDFGMVRYDMTPKPAYEAYRQLTQEHAAAAAPAAGSAASQPAS